MTSPMQSTTLTNLVNILGSDVGTLNKEVSMLNDETEDNLTTIRSGMDSNNIFTVLTRKRSDGTIFKTSTLSGGTSPQYTTRTTIYYKADGVTPYKTITHTLAYSNGYLVSETLN